jgi:hypothetical protein
MPQKMWPEIQADEAGTTYLKAILQIASRLDLKERHQVVAEYGGRMLSANEMPANWE